MSSELIKRDARSVWHPFTQVQTEALPLPISSARGALLFTEDGREIIDAIGSWWAVLHGHSEPDIISAVQDQLAQLQHTIFAGCTHQPAVELAELLLSILPQYDKVFYSDNGSTSVCVGLKMALQYFHNLGRPRKTIIAFEHAYHGDTFEAMSLGARGIFSAPFDSFLFDVKRIPPPVTGDEKRSIETMKNLCASTDVAVFIYEPLIMGAGGMIMYRPEPLNDLIKLAKDSGALCFADEVLTGFGRTGKLFASDHCSEKPDIVALSKALTGGTLPLGATLATEEIFRAFKGEEKSRALLHGHTYSGNPLACAAAVANVKLCISAEFSNSLSRIAQFHEDFLESMPQKSCRSLGTVCAIDVDVSHAGYDAPLRDKMYRFFLEQNILLRPLGGVVYTIPPLRITDHQIGRIYSAITECFALVQDRSL